MKKTGLAFVLILMAGSMKCQAAGEMAVRHETYEQCKERVMKNIRALEAAGYVITDKSERIKIECVDHRK